MDYLMHQSSQRTASAINAVQRNCILKFITEILKSKIRNTLIVPLDSPSMGEHNHCTIYKKYQQTLLRKP